MLWYKVWLESRTRFLIAAVVLIGFCFFATLTRKSLGPLTAESVHSRIYELIYSGTAKGTFAVLSIFLGLGSLVRERSRHTATFTLALPVTRFQLVRAQIGLGLLQLAGLSLLPALVLPLLSRLKQEPFALSDALLYSVLWFVCGSLIFAVAYLLSVVLEGEYTAAVVCYILLMLQALLASLQLLRPYRLNLLWTMADPSGTPWNRSLTPTGLPGRRLLVLALVTIAVFALSVWRTRKQDF